MATDTRWVGHGTNEYWNLGEYSNSLKNHTNSARQFEENLNRIIEQSSIMDLCLKENFYAEMVVLEKDRIEYQEANALLRQYQMFQWLSVSIFVSASFTIFALSWEVKEFNLLTLLAIASVGLYVVGLQIWKRYTRVNEIILQRIWELEKQMFLNLHLLIKSKDEEARLKSPIRQWLSRTRFGVVILCRPFWLFFGLLEYAMRLDLFPKC